MSGPWTCWMFSQVLPVRFFWIASCRKGCRDSSIRTTSWDESMLVSSTVGREKNKEQGCRGGTLPPRWHPESLLQEIDNLGVKRKGFPNRENNWQLVNKNNEGSGLHYIDDSTEKLYKKVKRKVLLVSHKPVSQIFHKTQRYKGALVTTFLCFWR